jgi:hypothetical protein
MAWEAMKVLYHLLAVNPASTLREDNSIRIIIWSFSPMAILHICGIVTIPIQDISALVLPATVCFYIMNQVSIRVKAM